MMMLPLAGRASAQSDVPATSLPEMITLEDALQIFRAHGLDLLIAEAVVMSAEGDLKIAGAIPNPNLQLSYSRLFFEDYANLSPPAPVFDSHNGYGLGLGDNNAIEDTLSGKRHLRLKVARSALAAARLTRVDAQRTLELQVKEAYIQAVLARDALDFALEVQKGADQIFELNKLRYEKGAISEADEAKVEAAKLEAEQAVDTATQALRVAKVALAFLLGVRGHVPDYRVEQDLPKYFVPGPLATATIESLLREAYERRSDLKSITAQRERAAHSVALARRLRFPDIGLNLGWQQFGGTGGPGAGMNVPSAAQPPTLTIGVAGNLPVFYLQAGEIRKAEADYRTQTLLRAKIEAQVAAEVETAYTNFASSRRLVERMEARLLDRVKRTRDLVQLQYQKGAASLLEFLDAQRQYIATNVEYLQDLTNYWTAVYQLEGAVGVELR